MTSPDILSPDRVAELLAQEEAADDLGLADMTTLGILRSHEALRRELEELRSAARNVIVDIDANITGSVADYLARTLSRLRALLGVDSNQETTSDG